MKVFLVFLALCIVNVNFIVFQGDMSNYLHLQNLMKAAAEECAAGAGLYYDEEAYGEGKMVISEKHAEAYIDSVCENILSESGLPAGSDLSWELMIHDDRTGREEGVRGPSVEVKLTLDTEDLFRLSFLKVTRVVRSAKYELADWG
ncbi:MAG: hypothetical protein SOY83_04035 [Anaerovoracaceae bacterium]|nr:hypothetical protein [Bacillota bacterium]MDY3954636.1 hypothetical protein [Anaerovoracaceae bacterium]